MTDRLDFEFKFAGIEGEAGEFSGFAATFGNADRVGDVIDRGAFTKTLAAHMAAGTKLALLWSHDPAAPVGVIDDVREDAAGLFVKGRLALDTQRGREVHALARMGALGGLSIGFKTIKAAARKGGRTLKEIDLYEISFVATPANPQARILSMKAADTVVGERKDVSTNDDPAVDNAELLTRIDALGTEIKTLTKRADDLEVKLARPAVIKSENKDEAKEVERKAFYGYVRQGRASLTADEAKALRVADDTAGGYLAPAELGTEIIKNLTQFSPVRAAATVRNTGKASVILPKRTGITNAQWEGEVEDSEESEPAFGQVEIPVFGMKTYTDISVQLLEDADHNVEAELSDALSEDFGKKEGISFIKGTGVKQPRGLMVHPDVAYTANGHATNLSADALIELFHAVPAAYRNVGVWMLNSTTIGAIRKLKASDGTFLWKDSLSEANPSTILGRPVVDAVDMDSIASGTFPILFGDVASAYRIYDRIQLAILRDPYTMAKKSLVRFHARRRVGGDVVKAEAVRKLKMAVS